MSFTLQNDSNVPTSKTSGGNAYWLNVTLVHVDGSSDGSGNGKWSYNSSASHKIKYNSTSQKWEDLADGQPSKISDTYNVNTTPVTGSSTGANPEEVFLWNNNGGQFLGKFSNPFHTTSGGGTSTEEVFVPEAKIVDYGGTTGFRFEQRSYPAGSYQLTPSGGSSFTWSLTSQSSNLQYHISQLIAGTYYLWQDSVQVATLVTPSSRKVFSNFW